MTFKEENIVNISMRAAELLKDGKIERDSLTGHIGLTNDIVQMAEEFEQKYKDYDWNAEVSPGGENLDYWEEIDRFAEEQLLEKYGRDLVEREDDFLPEGYHEALDYYNNQVGEDLESELVRRHAEELVDCYQHERDISEFISWTMYEALLDEKISYEESVALDRAYNEVGSGTDIEPTGMQEALRVVLARVRDEKQSEVVPGEVAEDPVKVYAVSAGGVRHEVYSGDLDECKLFCENNNWTYVDENEFEWDLEMEDSREDLLPEDYFMALDYYSQKAGLDIENEYVRQHAEELVFCFHKGMDIIDFDWWTQYETLLGEKLTFEEYEAVDAEFDGDPMELSSEDKEMLDDLREALSEFRERDPHLFTCLGDKEYMFLVKAVDLEDARNTGGEWYTATFFEPGRFDCWNTKKEDYEELNKHDVIESKAYVQMMGQGSLDDAIKCAENAKSEPGKGGMIRDNREQE